MNDQQRGQEAGVARKLRLDICKDGEPLSALGLQGQVFEMVS